MNGNIRLFQKFTGFGKFSLLDQFGKGLPCIVFQDPGDLPVTVVKEGRQFFQCNRIQVLFYIFYEKNYW